MNKRHYINLFIFAVLALVVPGLLLSACSSTDIEPPEDPAVPSPEPETKPPAATPIPPDLSKVPGEPEPPDSIYPPKSTVARERRFITIMDGKFVVDGDKPIWINGVNTPWNRWNDFGGEYRNGWWDRHFEALRANGVNASRVWINCNNDQGAVIMDEDGMVTGVSAQHWADLDRFFALAEEHEIYIMATFLSFDHFKSRQAFRWREMLMSDETVDSYIEHYTLPFLKRYQDNPYLWSIDLMNEPDWVHENEECGRLAWEDISRFFARNAAAIRENSDVLVTVGMSFPKYNADGPGYEGNKVSDAFLQSIYANENARLDFWSPHYYDWVGQWYGIPFTSSPFGPRSGGGWGLEPGRPAVLAEHSANGSAGSTLIEDFTGLFENGWSGAMPWTSNGVDGNGGFEEVIVATRHMAELHPELIFPLAFLNDDDYDPEPKLAKVPEPEVLMSFNEKITALDFAKNMGAGWNLGNTLDAVLARGATANVNRQETSWGNPETSRDMIKLLSDSGFKTLRIPITWERFIGPAPNYIIDKNLIDRVQEIVDWAFEFNMHVIINTHHESWNFPSTENVAAWRIVTALWHQVASRFAGYSEKLIFENMNEPRLTGTEYEWRGGTPEARGVINDWNSLFIDTVRATGYNNEKRFLLIPTHAASGENDVINDMWVPENDDRVMVSIHAYTPYDLVLNTRSSRNTFDPKNNNDTKDIDSLFNRLNRRFISQGTAVVMGETGMLNKDENTKDRAAWADYYTSVAASVGIPCIWWDNGIKATTSNEAFGIMNRRIPEWHFPEIVKAFVKNQK